MRSSAAPTRTSPTPTSKATSARSRAPPTQRAARFPGITTPDKYTIVFHLEKPTAAIVIDALALPLSAPVPEEYAKKFDAKKPSEYGNYQVATGPYMFKNNSEGKVLGIGYQPGKSATLVRNPNWNASTDFRPAYLDEIDIQIGGDTNVIGRQVLEGSNMVQNDPVAKTIVQLAYEQFRSQLEISPGAGDPLHRRQQQAGPVLQHRRCARPSGRRSTAWP